MQLLQGRWASLLDQQHRLPRGCLGRLVAGRMARQHAPETGWTLARLNLAPTDRVLELGFGTGQGLARAAQAAPAGYVIGVELSPTMLAVARRRNRRRLKSGQLALLRGDLTRLSFAEQQVDKIFSIHTFYFWPEPVAVISQLCRILRPGGRVVITLSPGRIGPSGELDYWPVYSLLEQEVLPAMRKMDFATVALEHGPISRQYLSIAVVAQKH